MKLGTTETIVIIAFLLAITICIVSDILLLRGEKNMRKRTIAFRILAIVLGVAALLGFFLFPVLHSRVAEALGSMMKGSGGIEELFNSAKNVTAFRMIRAGCKKVGGEPGAKILGYKNTFVCIIQFIIPAVGAAALILFGCLGKRVGGIGMICGGAVNLIFYILQMVLLPGSQKKMEPGMGLSYEFTFWQWILIVTAVAAIVVGILELVSTVRFYSEYSDEQSGSDYGYDSARAGGVFSTQGALVGVQGEYNGATIPIGDGVRIAIGRNADNCNLVLSDPMVSRIHCYVSYHAADHVYSVMDVSKFGVFDAQGNPIEKNVDVYMGAGDQIRIGQSQNIFTLG